MEVFNSARSSPLRLQLLRARDFKSFLFESDLMKAIPPSPFSYKSLCVKNKSVSLVFYWRPSAKRDIDAGLQAADPNPVPYFLDLHLDLARVQVKP